MPLDAENFSHSYVPDCSLTALLLLADPASIFLDEHRLHFIGNVALRDEWPITRRNHAALCACAHDLEWLRQRLKQAFTGAYAYGDIDVDSTQRLIDRFELWSD